MFTLKAHTERDQDDFVSTEEWEDYDEYEDTDPEDELLEELDFDNKTPEYDVDPEEDLPFFRP